MSEYLNDEIKQMLQLHFEIELKNTEKQAIIDYIDHLIANNFQQLINVLYKIDISENKIKLALQQQQNRKTAEVLVEMILERLQEKAESRKATKTNNFISEDEKF